MRRASWRLWRFKEKQQEVPEVLLTIWAQRRPYINSDHSITTKFVGYETISHTSDIVAMTTDDAIVDELTAGQKGTVIVAETPFYATSGGQAADVGVIMNDSAEFVVEDVIHLQGGKIGHIGTVKKGSLKINDSVNLKVNPEHRAATAKNHSATHLLQKALRIVLGNHVEQAGSFVSNERLRFDFTHFSAMTDEEIRRVEDIVNEHIGMSLPVTTKLMSIDEAKKEGAMALFGEKYSEQVRVVSMGEFSKELCGGTHVSNTGYITVFKILSDTGIAAGVRRIEALTGHSVLEYYKELEDRLYDAAKRQRQSLLSL